MFSRSAGLAAGAVRSCLLFVACGVALAGCARLKSAVETLVHRNRASKNPAARPSPRSTLAGARLAVILDDVGADAPAVDSIFALNYPLTLSILPNHPHSEEIAREAHHRGYQVMLHLPMESVANETAEVAELRPGMSDVQITNILSSMLRSVPYAAGVNNHQGSRATSDPELMSELMPMLHAHGLFFIDSRTTAATVAYEAAKAAHVPCAFRNVPFLDDVQETGAIRRELELAVRDAREKGQAVAIGHPHAATLRALADFLPHAETAGIHLVHASDVVH